MKSVQRLCDASSLYKVKFIIAYDYLNLAWELHWYGAAPELLYCERNYYRGVIFQSFPMFIWNHLLHCRYAMFCLLYIGYYLRKYNWISRVLPILSHMKWQVSARYHFTVNTAIFLQTSHYRHVSVTVWETRHIKTIRPVQNRGLTWYRRSHMGTLVFNSHCTWTRQYSHRTVQFPQRHVRC